MLTQESAPFTLSHKGNAERCLIGHVSDASWILNLPHVLLLKVDRK